MLQKTTPVKDDTSPKTDTGINVKMITFLAEYTKAKWPVVKEKHTKQSQ